MTSINPDTTTIRFDPWLALNLLLTGLMTASVAWSLSQFISVAFALPIGVALSTIFGFLARKLMLSRMSWPERLKFGVVALLIFLTTCGLSGATLYAKLFANSSALDWFAQARLPVQRQISQAVENGQTAANAFSAWQADAANKAKVEANGGGSCVAKAQSLGARGPIAFWREAEAGIAADLHTQLETQVVSLRNSLNAAESAKPVDFAQLTVAITQINAAIESSETLAHGAFGTATLGTTSQPGTLDRQLDSEIHWPNGEVFKCGDAARDELILRAKSALKALADTPTLQPLVPGIDLADKQALTIRGFMRSTGIACKVLTVGAESCFADDPLMATAWKKQGPLNRESLAWFITSLLEICVLISAAMVELRGRSPLPFDPVQQVENWQKAAEAGKTWQERLLLGCRAAVARALTRLFYTSGASPIAALSPEFADPVFPPRELAWGKAHLARFLQPMHSVDYLIIPAGEAEATTAARALCYHDAVEVVHFQATWEMLSEVQCSLRQKFRDVIGDIESTRFEVYKLKRDFAQALRLELLSLSSSQVSA